MTFTYTPGTPNDITRVRAKVSDRTSPGIRSDEEIQMWIDENGDWKPACIEWVQSVLMELNQEPDSTADWLRIDLESARENYLEMLDELKGWLGVSDAGTTATLIKLWRSDTLQDNPN